MRSAINEEVKMTRIGEGPGQNRVPETWIKELEPKLRALETQDPEQLEKARAELSETHRKLKLDTADDYKRANSELGKIRYCTPDAGFTPLSALYHLSGIPARRMERANKAYDEGSTQALLEDVAKFGASASAWTARTGEPFTAAALCKSWDERLAALTSKPPLESMAELSALEDEIAALHRVMVGIASESGKLAKLLGDGEDTRAWRETLRKFNQFCNDANLVSEAKGRAKVAILSKAIELTVSVLGRSKPCPTEQECTALMLAGPGHAARSFPRDDLQSPYLKVYEQLKGEIEKLPPHAWWQGPITDPPGSTQYAQAALRRINDLLEDAFRFVGD